MEASGPQVVAAKAERASATCFGLERAASPRCKLSGPKKDNDDIIKEMEQYPKEEQEDEEGRKKMEF